ncbi:hypothetical protein HAX54_023710, partial [Datura stramonium]|nr:hypothetical protein [Datura stramonium]
VACPLFRPLDKTVRANYVIILSSKTNKDAPVMMRGKSTENRTPPPPSAPFNTSPTQFHTTAAPTPTPPNLLKFSQRAQVHESQLVKLANTIPYMIQLSIQKPCNLREISWKAYAVPVEVIKNEVITLRKEVVALSGPLSTNNLIPPKPIAVPSKPEAPRSPLDDWWVGYDNMSKIVSNEELYHS